MASKSKVWCMQGSNKDFRSLHNESVLFVSNWRMLKKKFNPIWCQPCVFSFFTGLISCFSAAVWAFWGLLCHSEMPQATFRLNYQWQKSLGHHIFCNFRPWTDDNWRLVYVCVCLCACVWPQRCCQLLLMIKNWSSSYQCVVLVKLAEHPEAIRI